MTPRRVTAVALWASTAVAAQEPLFSERPLDFTLHLASTKLALDYGNASIDTAVKRIGVSWRERYGQRVQLGLVGGGSYLTQSNNAATAGVELDGYHAGISLDADLYSSPGLRLRAGASYLYQHLRHETAPQRVVINWREPVAHFNVAAALGGGVWANTGIRYGRIDGEQRLSGGQNETRPIGRRAAAGAVVGLELRLERDGYAGITAVSVMDRGITLYFGRHY